MKPKTWQQVLIFAAMIVSVCTPLPVIAAQGTVPAQCSGCHQAAPGTLWGLIKAGSQSDKAFSMEIDGAVWEIQYDRDTKLKKLQTVKQLPDHEAVMVRVEPMGEGQARATEIRYKPNLKFIPAEMVIEIDDLSNLLKQDAEKANYAVLDVRGYGDYIEGHIPGAISLPYYRFSHFKDRLPKDKNTHIITYCNSYG